MISLDKCHGSCNDYVDNISANARVPSKTKDVNVKGVNMITIINEAKTLSKHISCKCKCKFDAIKCSSNQNWNNNKCQCECKIQ